MKKREDGEDISTIPDQEAFTKILWYRPTSGAVPRHDPTLEPFTQACTTDFLDVSKRRRIKDNVTRKQPEAPRSPRNLPVSHGVACRYADKSGVTVITHLESDDKKNVPELHDPHYYDILPLDPTESVINKVKDWSNKWTPKGEINEDIRVYVENIKD